MTTHPHRPRLLLTLTSLSLVGLVGVAGACDGAGDPAYTYHRDARALLDAKCGGCHGEGDIGPFPLTTHDQVIAVKSAVEHAIRERTMPPWMPASGCNEYADDRSLSDDERELLLTWIEEGAPLGDPADAPPPAPAPEPVTHDQTLEMPEPYTPQGAPDDYRCFVLDWPEEELRYVTGFGAVPGRRDLVHHVIAFVVDPENADVYDALDEAEPGPGYTCFGGPGGPPSRWLAGWTPGARHIEFPEGTGIAVKPGSRVVLQLHYNTSASDPTPDRSRIELSMAAEVERPAVILPFTNIEWVEGETPMLIPAGMSHTEHSFTRDPRPYIDLMFGEQLGLEPERPLAIHSASMHMHNLGSAGRLSIQRADAEPDTCLLDIPEWDFAWQGAYGLQEPALLYPGDALQLDCAWDNSAANQPVVDGERVEPEDVLWGEGTRDEMCLGSMYVTRG